MLDGLEAFVKTAELGNFSSAARLLGVAPSSVTRQVDRLEDELKTKLFKRSTRKVSLTNAGEHYLQKVRSAMDMLDQAAQDINCRDSNEPTGRIGITCFESFGRVNLIPAIAEFQQRYPKVEIFMDLSNQIVDLYDDAYDLAIRTGKPKDSRMIARHLLDARSTLCATPEYLDQFGVPEKPADLEQHNCLTLYRGRQQSWWYFSRDKEQQKIHVKGNFQSVGGEPVKQMAMKDRGVILLPASMVQAELKAKELVAIMPEWQISHTPDGSVPVHMFYLPDPFIKPALRAFIDFYVPWLHERIV